MFRLQLVYCNKFGVTLSPFCWKERIRMKKNDLSLMMCAKQGPLRTTQRTRRVRRTKGGCKLLPSRFWGQPFRHTRAGTAIISYFLRDVGDFNFLTAANVRYERPAVQRNNELPFFTSCWQQSDVVMSWQLCYVSQPATTGLGLSRYLVRKKNVVMVFSFSNRHKNNEAKKVTFDG